MKRTWIVTKNGLVPKERKDPSAHEVMPDLEPFRSPDGAHFSSRTQWREHLRQTDTIELGHSDIAYQREQWGSRKAKFAEKVALGQKYAPESHGPLPSPDAARQFTALSRELAHKLDGRPMPDRTTMIKLSLDTQKELQRRGRR